MTAAPELREPCQHNEHLNAMSTKMDRSEVDVAALEGKDGSRHGELLQVLRKLSHVYEEGAGPGDFS